MPNEEILVLGATGKTGRRVVAQLQQRGQRVRPASHSGATRFEWYDEGTWAPALDGVRAAYVVDSEGADAAEQLAAFSEVAVGRGARRLVFLSARDWAVSGGEDRLAGERALTASGADWTILRPTWFAQNFSETIFLRDPVLDGKLVWSTGDGLEPFIDAEDIAAVAAAALTEDGHAGQTYELSGPRLLTFGAAVEEIARATGRDIAYVPVSETEYAVHAAERGMPAGVVEVLNLLSGWISAGRNAHLSDGVQRVLRREPRDFSDYVNAAAAAGAWKA